MSKSSYALDVLRVIIMSVGAAIKVAIGGFDQLLVTLIIFISVDYLIGVICAIKERTLSSRYGALGILKKFSIMCIIALSTAIEQNVFQTDALRSAVILCYISNEGISTIENCNRLGIPIPKKLKDVIMGVGNDDDTK